MKYVLLPLHLIRFWYPESISVFIRTWRNLILLLEEDLAVGLMWKLLFVPLFHDFTIVGRVLSLISRLIRVIIGLFAFSLATALAFALTVFWLLLPLLAAIGTLGLFSKSLLILGAGMFIVHVILHPRKKIWQVPIESGQVKEEDLWDCSIINKKDLNIDTLIASFEVQDLLSHLEITIDVLPKFQLIDSQKDQLIKTAYELAKNTQSVYLRPGHFFVALIQNTPNIDQELLKIDFRIEDFIGCLRYLEKKRNLWRRVYVWDDDFAVHHLKGVNRGWLGVPTPILDLFSEDLTRSAARERFSDFIGGEKVMDELLRVLSAQGERNAILVGPPGSGKSCLVRFLAKQIVAGDAPESLATKRLVLLDLTKLISGIRTQGELADRVRAMFEEVEFAQNIIIAIEEIHTLGEGEVGTSLNLYSLMQPYLESQTFQFLGTTEIENYNRVLRKNGAFARLFTKVDLPPSDSVSTLQILENKAIEIERRNKVYVSFLALKQAVRLGQKLIHDRVLPDSAISLLEEAQGKPVNNWINWQAIEEVVASRVKMPISQNEADKLKLLNLEEELHKRLIDQEPAVKAVADTLRRSATGLREESRPAGSFLFVGPTGVGKTELAKILSDIYFNTPGAFIRFDMSEYQNSDSIVRLIGGNGEAGQLTEAVSNRPFSLILLDEFEKADPKILTLFLQVLDDGRLTDGEGKLVDFTNTIIIATSNAGSLTIAKGLQAGQLLQNLELKVKDELLEIFKPELMNRFDKIVLFKPLSRSDLQKIVQLKLDQLKKQMEEKGYLINFDTNLLPVIASRGFDPVLGARPLRRLIQDTLESQLSRMILENKLTRGEQFIAGVELLQ